MFLFTYNRYGLERWKIHRKYFFGLEYSKITSSVLTLDNEPYTEKQSIFRRKSQTKSLLRNY